jgi:hypothetical protein
MVPVGIFGKPVHIEAVGLAFMDKSKTIAKDNRAGSVRQQKLREVLFEVLQLSHGEDPRQLVFTMNINRRSRKLRIIK